METQIIILFCFIDDYLKAIKFKDDLQAKMSSSEIITITIASAMFFGGNHEKSRRFFQDHRYFKTMLSKSQFNRRLHAINQSIWEGLNWLLARIFKSRNQTQEYTIDSFPIAVCQNSRINRCNLYSEEKFRGYNASKNTYFFGIRVHMICTVNKEPIEMILAPGSISDAKIFQQFDFDLPSGSKLYGDGMYNNYEFEQFLKETSGIEVLPIRKNNMKKQHPPYVKSFISHMRKSVETTFSQITNNFPKKIHAITSKGFEIKVLSFIFGYSIGLL